MGILLPTLSSLRTCLSSIRPSLKSAGPLADAVIAGITKRFGHLEDSDDLILASVSHPKFKLRWIQADAARVRTKYLLLQAMQAKAAAADSNAAVAPSSGDSMSFFCFYDSTPGNDGVQHELDLLLSDSARDICTLHRYPHAKEVFVSKNTSLPSSSPVERLFSIGGQIFTPRRNCLTDEHFEMLLLLRANKKLKAD
jgi:hypothetical protein